MIQKIKIANIALLTFLAISSGVAKVMLTARDLDFFQAAGWSKNLIIIFGVIQIVGGLFLLIKKVRKWGAGIVSATFFVSLVLLIMAGTFVPVGIFTIVTLILLTFILLEGSSSPVS